MSYTYYLRHRESGYKYYGYSEGRPENFWKEDGYCSSSQLVHYFIRRDGLSSFDARIHKIFDNWPKAKAFEGKFLRRVKAHKRMDWLNNNANGHKFGFFNTDITRNPPVMCPGCKRPITNFFRKYCTAKCSYTYRNKFINSKEIK